MHGIVQLAGRGTLVISAQREGHDVVLRAAARNDWRAGAAESAMACDDATRAEVGCAVGYGTLAVVDQSLEIREAIHQRASVEPVCRCLCSADGAWARARR